MPDRKGVTLIEVLVSILIIGISTVVLGTAFFAGLVFIDEAREMNRATNAAQKAVEEARNGVFSAIVNSPITAVSGLNNVSGGINVENLNDGNMKKVSVTINWVSRRGKTLSRSLVTIVTNRGIDRQ